MSRTVDLVREHGIDMPWWAKLDKAGEAIAEGGATEAEMQTVRDDLARTSRMIREVLTIEGMEPPVIEVTNVARMLWSVDKPVALYDFPCLAPPWDSFWMEYQHVAGTPERLRREWEKFGAFLDESVGLRMAKIERVASLFLSLDESNWPERRECGDPAIDSIDSKWCVRVYLFHQISRRVVGPNAMYHLFLDERGRTLDFQWIIPRAKGVTAEEASHGKDGFTGMMPPFLYALSLLHCKNVHVERFTAPPKVQEKRKRNKKPPLVRYQVVKVDPVTDRKRKVSDKTSIGSGEPPALHIVPGHFSHYGACCPGDHEPKGLLFGRLTGMYWMPMHARGSRQRGAVHSDYEMVLPEKRSGV